MKEMPNTLIEQIKTAIDHAWDKTDGHAIAAFDADGTLWDTDMGENFFQYQIEQNQLKDLPENPWEHYLKLKSEVSPKAAYLWLAQINKGQPIKTVRGWAQDCVEKLAPLPIFAGQKEIIDYLHSKGVQVYVVTASIKWSVEPAAALYDIPHERVLGVTTKIEDGIITEFQEGPITWRQGKVDGLLLASAGIKPILASGNTPGDLALLECASHIRLAMAASTEPAELIEEEKKLAAIAKEKDWFHFSAN